MLRFLRLPKKVLQAIIPNQIFSLLLSRVVEEYNELSQGEKDFFGLIESHVTSIVDVGARTDTFYATYPSSYGIKRKVFMFEANPVFVSKLRAITPSIDQNNFIFNVAIGKEPGNLYYYYDTQSFIKKSNVGNISKYKSAKPIEVRTLDSYSEIIPDIDFLKTDIEEMDFYALLGASTVLPKIRFIQFELGLGMPYLDRTVYNSDYWELLEPSFDLFILKDEANPIYKAIPNLSLLLTLNSEAKLVINILQKLGYGFNIVGINREYKIPQAILSNIGEINL